MFYLDYTNIPVVVKQLRASANTKSHMHKGFLTLRSSFLTKILKISTLHLCQKSKQWKTRPPTRNPTRPPAHGKSYTSL